ncbi:MAG: flagellin [Spirochaetia bacterium]|jgi:flagellin-like hook-associated protein FlgL|nr:flagellin [Spirochaetia bacterium]
MKNLLIIIITLFVLLSPDVYSQNTSSMDFLNRILGQNDLQRDKSFQRLSSGTLLWTDDPASQAIYEKVKSHIEYLSVNMRSQQDLVSYYQTREGYLELFVSSLQRIRELILMKSNGIYGPDDKEILDSEINHYYDGILKTISWAQFNTKPLFLSWMDDELVVDRFKEDDFYTLEGLDRILGTVLSERAKLGAILNTLAFRSNGLAKERENSQAFRSMGDTDFALELSNLKRSEIMFFSNLFLLKTQVQ